eukprot:GHVN01004356.1.p1 GENE.GHVN01004356.1~~GHVN01004356.1.p1  ORF type:complete len:823 (+),score=195.89 GHVN01004356.1:864-3332(+)
MMEYDVGGSVLEVTPLGAGREVGRSCVVISHKNRKVMLDCGVHPAHSGHGSLPIFDNIDVGLVDICLITHFHLDHSGALPYFISKTAFNGRVFMTDPTKAICKLLWTDYARANKFSTGSNTGQQGGAQPEQGLIGVEAPVRGANDERGGGSALFDESDINRTMDLIETVDFHQEVCVDGIKFVAYGAGHVLGACMFLVEIGGVRGLYTGDYSREVDRHVPKAEIPDVPVQVLICESTYGIRNHEPRPARERRFLKEVLKIIRRGGKCLLPVFALGRAQELLLMIDEYWAWNPEVQNVPVWYASPLSNKSMRVFETFINLCGDAVRQKADRGQNPFHFKYVKEASSMKEMRDNVEVDGPCVILAAPGMLQSGTSRELFEKWASSEKNGVIMTGYSVAGTLGDQLKKKPDTIELARGGKIPVCCSFETISFSAHSDFNQTRHFITALQAPNVVLVHGSEQEISSLQSKLKELHPHLAVFAPRLFQSVHLNLPVDRSAVAVGRLAHDIALNAVQPSHPPQSQRHSSQASMENEDMGVGCTERGKEGRRKKVTVNDCVMVVKPSQTPLVMYTSDIPVHASSIPINTFKQEVKIKFNRSMLKTFMRLIEELYEDTEVITFTPTSLDIKVAGRVRCEFKSDFAMKAVCSDAGMQSRDDGCGTLTLCWMSSRLSDMIADSISYISTIALTTPINTQSNKQCGVGVSLTNTQASDISDVSEMSDSDTEDDALSEVLVSHLVQRYSHASVEVIRGGDDTGEGEQRNKGDKKTLIVKFKLYKKLLNIDDNQIINVVVDVGQREVRCDDSEIRTEVTELLRRVEGAVLPMAPF